MLAGTRAIEGESLSDTLANVLKGQPDWSALPPSVPPRIRTFVQRCLEKDRSRRVADASTLAYVTEEALAPESGAGAISPAIARVEGIRRWVIPFSLIALATILVVGIAAWSLRHSLPAPGIMRFAISTFDGQLMVLSASDRRFAGWITPGVPQQRPAFHS
jgi:hypothetical protein